MFEINYLALTLQRFFLRPEFSKYPFPVLCIENPLVAALLDNHNNIREPMFIIIGKVSLKYGIDICYTRHRRHSWRANFIAPRIFRWISSNPRYYNFYQRDMVSTVFVDKRLFFHLDGCRGHNYRCNTSVLINFTCLAILDCDSPDVF